MGELVGKSSPLMHFPQEIGRAWTEYFIAAPTLAERRDAFRGRGGRKVRPSREVKEEG